jgi:putative transposase
MDGRGSWRDNVFVERLWRSIKYEEVYLRAYDTVSDARASIAGIWPSTTVDGLTRALTERPPTPLTSTS